MGNRFVDNKTPLDADTLNQFEDDIKQSSKLPVYNAVYKETTGTYKAYRISDVEWNNIPVGSLFSVIFDQSTQGTTDEVIGLQFGTATTTSTWYIFYSIPDYNLTFTNTQYVRVGSRKYLLANRPYVMKKIAASGSSTPLIAIMDHFETAKFGATLDVSGDSLQLKNLDGTAISSVTLPVAAQTTIGGIKIWLSGTVLYISTI